MKDRSSTVDMILKIVSEFLEDMWDDFSSYIEDCELALSLTSQEHCDWFLKTVKINKNV